MASKGLLFLNSVVLTYLWLDKDHYRITSYLWVDGKTIHFLVLVTLFQFLAILFFQDSKEKWIPIHGILRAGLRSFCSAFTTPLTMLVVKLLTGFGESAKIGRGLLEVKFHASLAELDSYLQRFCSSKPGLLDYLKEGNKIQGLMEQAEGSFTQLGQLLEQEFQHKVALEKELASLSGTVFDYAWGWVQAHPQQSLCFIFCFVAGLVYVYDRSLIWNCLFQLKEQLIKINQTGIETSDVLYKASGLARQSSLCVGELSQQMVALATSVNEQQSHVTRLSALVEEVSPILSYLAQNRPLLEGLLQVSGTLTHFGQVLEHSPAELNYTPQQKIGMLSSLAYHHLQGQHVPGPSSSQ